jgi:hypothetical protein
VPKSLFQIAGAWLSTVKEGDPASLAASTALPFTFATTEKKKACQGTMKTAAALETWVACARRSHALWLAELDVKGEPPLAEGGTDGAKLAALMKKAAPRAASWVRAAMTRDGVTYTFRFAIDDKGEVPRVAAFVLDVAPESG